VLEDGPHDTRVGEEGEDAHLTVAGGAAQGEDLVDAGDELSPSASRDAIGRVIFILTGSEAASQLMAGCVLLQDP